MIGRTECGKCGQTVYVGPMENVEDVHTCKGLPRPQTIEVPQPERSLTEILRNPPDSMFETDFLKEENKDLKRKIKALTSYDLNDRQLEIMLNLFDRLIDRWEEQHATMDDLTAEIFETLQEAVTVIKDRERYKARK